MSETIEGYRDTVVRYGSYVGKIVSALTACTLGEELARSYAAREFELAESSEPPTWMNYLKVMPESSLTSSHASALWSLALMGAWSALESAIDDICLTRIAQCAKDASWPQTSDLAKITLPLSLATADPADVSAWVLESIKSKGDSSLKKGVGQFEVMLKALDIKGEIPPPIRDGIYEVKEVRNLFAHKSGVVDRKFKDSLPDWDHPVGEALKMSERQLIAAIYLMSLYLQSVASELVEIQQQFPPGYADFQAVLDSFRRF